MAIVHLLHGLPGSGKTTFARRLEARERTILLSHDEWMVTLHGRNPPREHFPRYAGTISQLMWQLVGRLLAAGNDVVLDWGFWTRASRDAARSEVVTAGGTARWYRMMCAPELARQRTLDRTHSPNAEGLWINGEAWDAFATLFEPMAEDEPHVDVE